MSRGIADALAGFINRSSLPSSGRPTDISRTAQVKLSSLAANSRRFYRTDKIELRHVRLFSAYPD
jgi:hypothetical protein